MSTFFPSFPRKRESLLESKILFANKLSKDKSIISNNKYPFMATRQGIGDWGNEEYIKPAIRWFGGGGGLKLHEIAQKLVQNKQTRPTTYSNFIEYLIQKIKSADPDWQKAYELLKAIGENERIAELERELANLKAKRK